MVKKRAEKIKTITLDTSREYILLVFATTTRDVPSVFFKLGVACLWYSLFFLYYFFFFPFSLTHEGFEYVRDEHENENTADTEGGKKT